MKLKDNKLRIICTPVKVVADIEQYIEPMFNLMYESNGVGLAANQVGILQKFFIMDVSKVGTQKFVIINPTITFRSKDTILHQEGCLSYPGELVFKKRHCVIKIEYTNLKGMRKVRKFKNKQAIIVQHELDHLLGKKFLKSD